MQLLGQDGYEWFIPVILQCCRESRLLSYKVLHLFFLSLLQLNKQSGPLKESKEIADCTMLLRNVATAFNNKKVVTAGRKNGFIGISNQMNVCDVNRMPSMNSPRFSSPRAIIGFARTFTRVTTIEFRSNSKSVPKAKV